MREHRCKDRISRTLRDSTSRCNSPATSWEMTSEAKNQRTKGQHRSDSKVLADCAAGRHSTTDSKSTSLPCPSRQSALVMDSDCRMCARRVHRSARATAGKRTGRVAAASTLRLRRSKGRTSHQRSPETDASKCSDHMLRSPVWVAHAQQRQD